MRRRITFTVKTSIGWDGRVTPHAKNSTKDYPDLQEAFSSEYNSEVRFAAEVSGQRKLSLSSCFSPGAAQLLGGEAAAQVQLAQAGQALGLRPGRGRRLPVPGPGRSGAFRRRVL